MSYYTIDKSRENDPYVLADVEIIESAVWLLDCVCGEYEIPSIFEHTDRHSTCPSCEEAERPVRNGGRMGFWYQYGMPGYMPESDPVGPFDAEQEALAAARESAGYCPHGVADYGEGICEECPAPELWALRDSQAPLYMGACGPVADILGAMAWTSPQKAIESRDRMAFCDGTIPHRLTDSEARRWGR